MVQKIELPDPVIEVNVESVYREDWTTDVPDEWDAEVRIGGVVVMKRRYRNRWDVQRLGLQTAQGEELVEDDDDVRMAITATFGRKMRDLLGDM